MGLFRDVISIVYRIMIYTRNQINKFGDSLISEDPFTRSGIDEVEKWRNTHLPVLQDLSDQMNALLSKEDIPFDISSQRIKRMTSIVEKLRNNREKQMKLGGLQDIGGARYVFGDMEQLKRFDKILASFVPDRFEMKKRYDYIETPKDSGYRSIHYVYKYLSENETYNGLQIELQIRTHLQHCWAMAVETASLISRTSLKADIKDDSEWRCFFKLVSAIFARKEGQPVSALFTDYDNKRYCDEFEMYCSDKRLFDQIKALRVTVNHNTLDSSDKYCVLVINFEKGMVNIKYVENAEKASGLFSDIERKITENEAALMVSMQKMEELRQAYPSYFLDTEDFIKSLEEFDMECALLYR